MADGTCKHCGSEISADASPRGICAKCLIRLALEAPDEPGPLESEEGASVISEVDEPPERIGPYRILRKLGEGGMGVVYQAEQLEPLRRTVALKLIKAGMDTAQVVARFESERQALAIMDHPGIARVFDAGSTDQGRPYFVMEYVDGEPITAYCDRTRLTTIERLELFRRVCVAAQHAHQKGVIHRDIKPSNVLVADHDGNPTPKIIDFGVAKATQQRLTERTLYTQFGAMVGTPEYMSPEQARIGSSDVDTRSDVYSLGVVLYELLVGALPFDSRELKRAGFEEICRRIREDEPSKPSTRLTTLGDDSRTSAELRRTDPRSLERELRGDLDWIVMKALAKEPSRRYGSASDLAEDIRRHVAHEPVSAGPPSRGYRLRKFVRRHRVGVVTAAVVLVSLVLGVVGTTYGLLRSRQAERDASTKARTSEQVSEFLVNLFDVSDPANARGEDVTAKQILDAGAAQLQESLSEETEVREHMLRTLGRVYMRMGENADARPLLEEALRIEDSSPSPDIEAVIDILHDLAWVEIRTGHTEAAAPLFTRALDLATEHLGSDHWRTLMVIAQLGNVYRQTGKLDEGERLLTDAMTRLRASYGLSNTHTLSAMVNLGALYNDAHRYPEARAILEEAVPSLIDTLGTDDPKTLTGQRVLADTYHFEGEEDAASRLYEEIIPRQRRVLQPDHTILVNTLSGLAAVRFSQGRYAEAAEIRREVLEAYRRTREPDHPAILRQLLALARCLDRDRRYEEALPVYRELLERRTRTLGADHPDTLETLEDLNRVKARM